VRRRLTLALTLAAVLGGCGGGNGPDGSPEQTVRDFVDATNRRDAERFCNELVTQGYLDSSTGLRGDAALKACEKDFRALRGLRLKLLKIRETKIDGDRASVRAELEANGRRQVQLLRLREVDGRWKLAGGRGS
jgi:hypothetical protein